jgi:beta-galactosidase
VQTKEDSGCAPFNSSNRNSIPLKYILALYWFLSAIQLNAQQGQRVINGFNDDWEFIKDADMPVGSVDKKAPWQSVRLPHTWNIADVMDDVPGYYRGVGWYKKTFTVDARLKSNEMFLYFEGANQATEVYVNGTKAGTHTGGYTSFYIPVHPYLRWSGVNEVIVKVDNSYDSTIAPLSADFTFFGGLYRDVFLVSLNPVHFSLSDKGGKGVYVSTPLVSKENARVNIKGVISNNGKIQRKVKVHTFIRNRDGNVVLDKKTLVTIKPGFDQHFIQEMPAIQKPHLWSPEDPYLYKITTTIIDAASGIMLDEITNPLGLRWFSFDAGKGFFLNGESYKLIGASRHQDYPGMGNAVPDALARRDVELLKNMGGNFLRVAHYPQDPSVLEACDSIGLLASVEIPVVNEISESAIFYNNCENMQREMIKQNFNHPSVIIWCYMNEVLLKPHFNNDKERQKIYFSAIERLAKRLDSITRAEDPARYTMIAHHGDLKRYRDAGLINIPMVVGWNLYSGWYGAELGDFPVFLDAFHTAFPDKPMLVTEYGADADPRIRSRQPVRFDKSVEYTTNFHQFYLTTMMERPFVTAAVVWNLADFNSETRTETMPHINNKGLLEWDRTPKDPYYFYQAMLLKKPFIKILGPSIRGGVSDSIGISYQSLQVAANVDSVSLFVNGKRNTTIKIENGLGVLAVPFVAGVNHIEAKSGEHADTMTIRCELEPYYLGDDHVAFHQLNILLGANRFFTEKDKELVWLPDQPYRKGAWGSVGGKPFRIANGRMPYGTDKNINGTDNDPVYQSQQTGIDKYKLDVPAGEYELTLYFAELMGGAVKVLPYDLSGGGRNEEQSKRIFDVYVNGVLMLDKFDIAGQYGSATAVSKSIKITVADTKGIEIEFKAVVGETVLNALELKRLPGKAVNRASDTISDR